MFKVYLITESKGYQTTAMFHTVEDAAKKAKFNIDHHDHNEPVSIYNRSICIWQRNSCKHAESYVKLTELITGSYNDSALQTTELTYSFKVTDY